MPIPPIAKGGTRGTVFREVAKLRMDDATALLKNKRRNGAIYMAGYGIECQLKYAYCRRKNSLCVPASLEVHDWERLVDKAGLLKDIKVQPTMDAIYSALVENWGPGLRYQTANYSEIEAKLLYNQMNQLYQFFKDLVP